MRRLEIVDRQADLLEVVDALGAAGRLAGRLDGGQEQADQDGDDGDHHQQLDQGEPSGAVPIRRTHGEKTPETDRRQGCHPGHRFTQRSRARNASAVNRRGAQAQKQPSGILPAYHEYSLKKP